MSQYSLVTHWHLEAQMEQVWKAIVVVEEWLRWWKYVRSVFDLEKGGEDGLGSLRRYTWTSRLPYRLSFEMRVSAVKRPSFLEGVATGELAGTGRWYLAPEGETTRVRYEWTVSATSHG